MNSVTPHGVALFTSIRKPYCNFNLHKLMENDFKNFIIYSSKKLILYNPL
jgi:hypothetical protein